MVENFEIVEGSLKFKYQSENMNDRYLRFRKHFHTEYELYYLINGDIEFQVEEERYIINPFDVLFIRPGQHHNAIVKSPTLYSRIVLRFSSSDISEELEKQLRTLPVVFNIKGQKSAKAFESLLDLKSSVIESCVVTALTCQMGVILCNLCSDIGKKKEAKFVSRDLEKAIRYIEENLKDIHSEEDLCNKLNKSPSAIRKLFTRNLNTSVMSYVRAKKCMKAHEMLKAGLSPKQVYRDCGFNYYSTFYRDYKKIYGKSPLDY